MGDDKLEKIVSEMREELSRNLSSLKVPFQKDLLPGYLSYVFTITDELTIVGDLGDCVVDRKKGSLLEAEIGVNREGKEIDGYSYDYKAFFAEPSDDSVRVALWRMTDDAFKSAVKDYLDRERARLSRSPDDIPEDLRFRKSWPVHYRTPERSLGVDSDLWKSIVEVCTDTFKQHPCVVSSSMDFSAKNMARVLVNSEGSEVITRSRQYSIDVSATGITSGEDNAAGDTVEVVRQFYVREPSDLPSLDAIMSETEDMLVELDALLKAPVQRPAERPVLFDQESSAQLFYTLLGNSVLNRCGYLHNLDRNASEKGDHVLPEFISVNDMPDTRYFIQHDGKKVHLNGYSMFDEQGVPCKNLTLVKCGVVNEFPCTREYVGSVSEPNGRGRFDHGSVVPGTTNMFISSKNSAENKELVNRLLAMCDEQGHDYGLILIGSMGSELVTDENYFNVTPRLAYRLWSKDGVDDQTGKCFSRGELQLVRDVQVVGNPELMLSNLEVTGKDYSVCSPNEVEGLDGVYQGGDVSVISPSALFSRVELKRELYSKTRPPILPHPLHDKRRER